MNTAWCDFRGLDYSVRVLAGSLGWDHILAAGCSHKGR